MPGGGAQTKRRPWIRGSPRPFLPRRSYRKRASFPPMLGTGAAGPGSVPTLPLAGELTTPGEPGSPPRSALISIFWTSPSVSARQVGDRWWVDPGQEVCCPAPEAPNQGDPFLPM